MASGIPMIVTKRATAVTTWPIAIQTPASTNQITLPMPDAAPADGLRTTVRPNGQSTNPASRNAAIPNGMVTTSSIITTPARA